VGRGSKAPITSQWQIPHTNCLTYIWTVWQNDTSKARWPNITDRTGLWDVVGNISSNEGFLAECNTLLRGGTSLIWSTRLVHVTETKWTRHSCTNTRDTQHLPLHRWHTTVHDTKYESHSAVKSNIPELVQVMWEQMQALSHTAGNICMSVLLSEENLSWGRYLPVISYNCQKASSYTGMTAMYDICKVSDIWMDMEKSCSQKVCHFVENLHLQNDARQQVCNSCLVCWKKYITQKLSVLGKKWHHWWNYATCQPYSMHKCRHKHRINFWKSLFINFHKMSQELFTLRTSMKCLKCAFLSTYSSCFSI